MAPLIVGCVLSDQTEAQITYTVKVRFVPVVFSTLIVQLVLDVGYDWEISWIVGLLTEAPPLRTCLVPVQDRLDVVFALPPLATGVPTTRSQPLIPFALFVTSFPSEPFVPSEPSVPSVPLSAPRWTRGAGPASR